MQRITRDRLAVVFDRTLPCVATVAPGEQFIVETEDDRGGRTRTVEATTPAALLAMRAQGWHGNPVTGPIYVTGAQPGDTLAVHVHAMACDHQGQIGYWPSMFRLYEFFDLPSTTLVEIHDRQIHLSPDIKIPVRPMIGTIGVAPALETIFTGRQGRHGGNLDVPEVCPGSILYLPINVPGAYLGLGDCHAIQGDGELNEVEMRSEVTLSCEIIRGRVPGVVWPYVETATHWVTIGAACPLEEAQTIALHEMIRLVMALTSCSAHEAYHLIGVTGHARPGQVQGGLYTMRCLLPKAFLPDHRNIASITKMDSQP